ncbi:nitroreductase family deazaflavin-dependent oxidoreductase [Mycobacterium colombiense]|uniref:nitroreductase family deazaflavin-dependent oxidoreductase n=1 Tax=Mycobacterium colombiense TaxID=339268 RepID=UPI0026476706|nr:nitroreductase family deazaflavin-dependent oxidoreductase [Mycobacterium colombiense]
MIWLSRFPQVKDLFQRTLSRSHSAIYRWSQGRFGMSFGAPALLITAPGRKTGQARTTPVYYLRHGDDFVVAGSYAGDHRAPQWYLNVMAAQSATVQIGSGILRVTARLATPHEKCLLWPKFVAMWPSFDDYQRHTKRDIPLVVLKPCR